MWNRMKFGAVVLVLCVGVIGYLASGDSPSAKGMGAAGIAKANREMAQAATAFWVALTPAFLVTNPAEAKEGPRKGTRVLGVEEDMARALVKALDEGQKKTAIYTAEAPKEIVTSNSRKAMIEKPVGLLLSEMKGEQK